MGLMDINSELGGLKGKGLSLHPTPKQAKYLIRNISGIEDEVLWRELGELRENAVVTFREIGRRLKELQDRYAKRGSGDFEKRWRELGFKKMEVYTLIKKYDLYTLDASKEESIMLGDSGDNRLKEPMDEPLEAEIVCSADNEVVAEKLEGASQRVISALGKAPPEVREDFYEGKINSENEIKEASKPITPGKIIKEEVIEDDRREARVKELIKELKDIDAEIKPLLEYERQLKELREQREEVIEELSKVRNLKLL